MSNNCAMLVRTNLFGFPIKVENVDDVLNEKPLRGDATRTIEHILSFLGIKEEQISRDWLVRYADASDNMSHISMGISDGDIHDKLIKPVAEAKRCYTFGQTLACIQCCALAGEMLANYYCILHENEISNLDIEKIFEGKRRKEQIKNHLKKESFYDLLDQSARLTILSGIEAISNDFVEKIKKVHKIRKRYFHHWEKSLVDIEKECLEALSLASKIISENMDVLDRDDNQKKIKAYILRRGRS